MVSTSRAADALESLFMNSGICAHRTNRPCFFIPPYRWHLDGSCHACLLMALALSLPIAAQRPRRSSCCYQKRRLRGGRSCNERQTRFMTRLRPRAAPTCVPEEEEEEEEEQEEE